MKTLLVKEFRQGWRTFKIPAFLLVVLFFALLDPPTTKYMKEIMQYFAGDIQIVFPEPTSEQAFLAFLSSVSQMGFLALIFICMGIVANEKTSGVMSWILTQPVARRDYLLSKVAVLSLTILGGVVGAGLMAYLYSWSLLGSLSFFHAMIASISLGIYGIFLMVIAFSGSVILQSSWGAGVLAIVVMASSSLIHVLSNQWKPITYLPYGLVASSQEIFSTFDGSLFLGRSMVTLLIVIILFLLSLEKFKRTELG